jgi:hypothetical protein
LSDLKRVNPAGSFADHRTIAGTPAAESATLSDANFPPANALHCAGAKTILVYYDDDSGGAGTITFQPLIRDGVNGLWLPRPTVVVTGRSPAEITVFGANEVFLRVNAVAAPGNNAKVRAAVGEWMSARSG